MITIDKARTLYEAAGDSTHDFDHVLRVYHLAERIGHAEGAELSKVKDTLFTEAARAIASKRHSFMADFFEEMAAEVAGER